MPRPGLVGRGQKCHSGDASAIQIDGTFASAGGKAPAKATDGLIWPLPPAERLAHEGSMGLGAGTMYADFTTGKSTGARRADEASR